MAHITADRVRDTSTTTGTGSLTVSGTAPTGYRTFSAVSSTNDTFYYALQHQTAAEWEVGLGTYSGTNTIARTTILASSNAGSVVNLSAGTKDVFITFPAALFDGAKLKVANGGTGATTLTANNVLLGNGTSAVQAVAPGSSGNVLTSNGTTWTSAAPSGGSINVQTFTSSGTWTKPSGFDSGSRVLVQVWGAGGSGGRHSTATSVGGGGGGGYNEAWLTLSQFGATETITIGAGGVSRTGSNQAGAAGGNTTVGSLITAYGGGGGGTTGGGGGGGGQLSAGSTGISGYANPGLPFIVAIDLDGSAQLRQGAGNSVVSQTYPSSDLAAFWHGGGGGAGSATATYNAGCSSVWGGGGGAGHNTGTGGTSSFGGNGGASGATGTAGSQPGGGGGGGTSTSGAGGNGKVIITVFPA